MKDIYVLSAVVSILCTLALRFLFSVENKRRDHLNALSPGSPEFEEYSLVETIDRDGKVVRRQVDKMFLDMSDKENLAFRYVL